PSPTPTPASQCNTDHLYCCNNSSLVAANNPLTSVIFGLLNIAVAPLTAIVGLGAGSCNSITVAGLLSNGNTCSQSPVCCENNDFSGLVVIGCSPVALGI
ncbi:fungal hydrophobin, partial [Macrolepiota fuliginosa MF-IS2]